jgi:hypothetical protein
VDARIDEFDQSLLEDVSLGPEIFDQLREAQQQLGLLHGDRPTCSFLVLKDYFAGRGHSAVIVDPTDLTYNGDSLSADRFRIDIFYKRVVIHEFLNRWTT